MEDNTFTLLKLSGGPAPLFATEEAAQTEPVVVLPQPPIHNDADSQTQEVTVVSLGVNSECQPSRWPHGADQQELMLCVRSRPDLSSDELPAEMRGCWPRLSEYEVTALRNNLLGEAWGSRVPGTARVECYGRRTERSGSWFSDSGRTPSRTGRTGLQALLTDRCHIFCTIIV